MKLKKQDGSRAVILNVWFLYSGININWGHAGNKVSGPTKSKLRGWVLSNPCFKKTCR